MSSQGPSYRSLSELQHAIREGKTSVKDVAQQYLAVIEKMNGENHALTTTNQYALEEAERLDGLPEDERGPLFGFPLVLKDQFETAGIPTSFGSIACKDYLPEKDATVVRKLKEAGALILGKASMCDWAAGYNSLSSLTGTTQHPIDPTRDPGGSSAGSGAAVASNMALAAIGGDTGGSIRLPASFCGLVGVRVTPGRISRSGMSALLTSQDTPGPMTWTVEDAARLLDVLVGFDDEDNSTSINTYTGRTASPTQFLDAIKQPFLEGKRLGVLRQAFGAHKGINGVLENLLSRLKSAGVELVEVQIPRLEHYMTSTAMYVLRSKSDINSFLATRPKLSHLKVEDLHAKGVYHPALPLVPAMVKGPSNFVQSPHYGKALDAVKEFQMNIASEFAKHDLDAIVYPTCQILAPKTQYLLDGKWNHTPNTVIGSQSLFTALSLPVGRAKDDNYPNDPELPVGLEILGVPLSEERILNIAAGIEALQQ